MSNTQDRHGVYHLRILLIIDLPQILYDIGCCVERQALDRPCFHGNFSGINPADFRYLYELPIDDVSDRTSVLRHAATVLVDLAVLFPDDVFDPAFVVYILNYRVFASDHGHVV